jgi:type IV pilus assembly protein PilO
MSFIDDLKNLDPNNPGQWPLPVQLALCAIILGIVLFAGYKFDISKQLGQRDKLKQDEVGLREKYEEKQKKVANLDELKEQMKEMQQSFGEMLRLLPNKTEVDALIVDISQEGLSAGLEFDLFRPRGEAPSEFYVETPIDISVRGTYHQLGEFISGVAALPRIVTTHNLNISKSQDRLTMTAVAKTYRALDEE